jgi:hypothetical protein
MSEEKGVTVAAPSEVKAPIEVNKGGIVLKTIDDLYRIAAGIHASGMAPKSLNTRDKVAVAILTGAEAGLSPMAAVRSIYVVNGAPAWISKAARAQVLSSGLLKPGTKIEEGVCHADNCPRDEKTRCGDDCEGYCKTWRNGDHEPREHTFSVAEAKLANLWKKSGPWQEYPQRMLMHRAAGFHFDDCWQDVLMGLTTVAVMQDHPQAAFIREGEAIVTDATPPGRDPLLPPASGAVTDVQEAAGEGAVDDVSEPSEPADAPDPVEPDTTGEPAASRPTPGPFPSDEALRGGYPMEEPHPITTDPIEGPEDGEPEDGEPEDGEPEAATDPTAEPLPPRYVGDEEEEKEPSPKPKKKKKAAPKKKPVPDQQAPFIATCSVDGCGKEFDPHKEVHWNHEGVFRCSSCGAFPK